MVVADGDALDPAAVLAAFGLPGPVTAWDVVSRAWSNRVYRLTAGGHRFAVKEMRNPWSDARWQQWLAESWSFEQRAIGAGVAAPQPVPNPADGSCLAWVSRLNPAAPMAVIRLHHWVDGDPVGCGPVEPGTARWAGRVLAILHGMQIRPQDRSLFPVPSTETAHRWPELTEAAERCGLRWAPLMAAVTGQVSVISELVQAAGHQPDQEVMTHGDIDQKNLIAAARGPVLCDWDLAAPLVPRRELGDVAMSLACWKDFGIARDVVRSYRLAGGDDTRIEPPDLGQALMIGLDWIAFNVERATGLRPATAGETTLAHQLVPELLAALPKQIGVTVRIVDILKL